VRLREMLPHQLERAVADGWPLLVPAGCVEFHGHHLALGSDTLFAEAVCEGIAARMPAVVAPTIDYGPTGYALTGPERGTIDTAGEAFGGYAKEVLRNFWEMGWQRVRVIIHHQGMDGPEALAFRKAAAEVTFEETREERGRGWWGSQSPAAHGGVWERLGVGPTILPAAASVAGGDHAGKWETSLLLHLRPDLVEMERLSEEHLWYTEQPGCPSADGSADLGARMLEAMVSAWVAELRR
jgi:creatinine amidohydrolase